MSAQSFIEFDAMPRTHLHVYTCIGFRDCVPQQGRVEFERGDGDVVLLSITGDGDKPRNSKCRRDVTLIGGNNYRAMLHSRR